MIPARSGTAIRRCSNGSIRGSAEYILLLAVLALAGRPASLRGGWAGLTASVAISTPSVLAAAALALRLPVGIANGIADGFDRSAEVEHSVHEGRYLARGRG